VGKVQVVQVEQFGDDQASRFADLVGSDVQILELLQLQQALDVRVADVVIGEGKLRQISQLTYEFQRLTCYLIAPDIQALQIFELDDRSHPIIWYLVVVYKQFTQILKAVADGEEPEIANVVFSQNQCLKSAKRFDAFDVLICNFAVRQVYFFSVRVDDNILDGSCPWPAVAVNALHH